MPTFNAMALPFEGRAYIGAPPAGASRAPDQDVHAAIARASAATGVDFGYLLAQAKLESGLNPSARASTSSAAGLHQFLSGTWLETMDWHGASYGFGWAEEAISRQGGRAVIADPALRSQVMALRYDPTASSLMAAELARENAQDLRGFLGREPDHAELYLAHFLGSGGARDFLGALQANPAGSAAAQFPKAAAANRALFYDGAQPRSLDGMMALIRAKVSGAMDDGLQAFAKEAGASGFAAYGASFGPAPRYGAPATPPAGAREGEGPQRPSMAETLRATFGADGVEKGALTLAAAHRVDDAYAKFRAFGL